MQNFKTTGIFVILVALLVSSNFCLRNHDKKLIGKGHPWNRDQLAKSSSSSLSSAAKYKMDGKVSGDSMEGKIYKPNGSVFATWYLFKK